jgi:hypothetical protein
MEDPSPEGTMRAKGAGKISRFEVRQLDGQENGGAIYQAIVQCHSYLPCLMEPRRAKGIKA